MVGVLFLSPHISDAGTLSRMLRPVSLSLDHVTHFADGCRKLEQNTYGVILTEAQLPDGTWEDVLNLVQDRDLASVVIVTHRLADERLWAEVLNLGAYDLLVQPFDAGEVQRILASASRRGLQKPVESESAVAGKLYRAAL